MLEEGSGLGHRMLLYLWRYHPHGLGNHDGCRNGLAPERVEAKRLHQSLQLDDEEPQGQLSEHPHQATGTAPRRQAMTCAQSQSCVTEPSKTQPEVSDWAPHALIPTLPEHSISPYTNTSSTKRLSQLHEISAHPPQLCSPCPAPRLAASTCAPRAGRSPGEADKPKGRGGWGHSNAACSYPPPCSFSQLHCHTPKPLIRLLALPLAHCHEGKVTLSHLKPTEAGRGCDATVPSH